MMLAHHYNFLLLRIIPPVKDTHVMLKKRAECEKSICQKNVTKKKMGVICIFQ